MSVVLPENISEQQANALLNTVSRAKKSAEAINAYADPESEVRVKVDVKIDVRLDGEDETDDVETIRIYDSTR